MEEMNNNEENSLDYNRIREHNSRILKKLNIKGLCESQDNNVSILKSNQDKDFDKENINFNVADEIKSSNCEENDNTKFDNKELKIFDSMVPKKKSKLPGRKKDSNDDKNVKIPRKTRTFKKQKKSKRKTVARPILSIFDNNLLRDDGGQKGCECTLYCKYENPFLKDVFEEIARKRITQSAVVSEKIAYKEHIITFAPKEEFQYIATKFKPTLYVSEYVTGTDVVIGCKYTLTIRLVKNNVFVGEYVAEHTFTKKDNKKKLEIWINDYSDFDRIYYMHVLSGTPSLKLTLAKIFGIQIGESVLMFLSDTIQWTKPGPKVIVEMVERLPDEVLY